MPKLYPPPQLPRNLARPDPVSAAHGLTVQNSLLNHLQALPERFMPFDEFMDLALYAPGLGYYAAGSHKFGASGPEGDFTTAPELSPLFGQTLARQVAQVLEASQSDTVLEFGAGSGALAASLIPALRQLGIEPRYQILEISADLRERQQQKLATLEARIEWLDVLPQAFSGCIIGNEVLDAMPVKRFRWTEDDTLLELGVSCAENADPAPSSQFLRADAQKGTGHTLQDLLQAPPFRLAERPANATLEALVRTRAPFLPAYQSEINLRAEAWIRQIGTWLERGAALLIDYGFPQHEYYHPQRAEGTLMCHFRHQAHDQPLVYVGLQDITAHIDFTAMADAALEGGLDVMGYTSQARFLMNLGITQLLSRLDPTDAGVYARTVAPVQKLLAESEMGELFKVLAVGRNIDVLLDGFRQGDRRHRLA